MSWSTRHILSITVNTVIDRLKNKVISTTKARMNPQIKALFSVKKKLSIDRQVVNLSLSFCFSLNVQISDNWVFTKVDILYHINTYPPSLRPSPRCWSSLFSFLHHLSSFSLCFHPPVILLLYHFLSTVFPHVPPRHAYFCPPRQPLSLSLI